MISKNLIIGVIVILGAYLTLLLNVVLASKKVDEHYNKNSSSEDEGNRARR